MADPSCSQGEPSQKAVALNLLITVDKKQNQEDECGSEYQSQQQRPCTASIPLQQECCCCCAPPPPPPPRSQKSCCCCPPPRSSCPKKRPCSQPAVPPPCLPPNSLVLPCGCLALFDDPQSRFAAENMLGMRGKSNNAEVQCSGKKMVEKGVCDGKPPCSTAGCQTLSHASKDERYHCIHKKRHHCHHHHKHHHHCKHKDGRSTKDQKTTSSGAQTATTSIPKTKEHMLEGQHTRSKTNLSRSRSKMNSSKTGLSQTPSGKVSESKERMLEEQRTRSKTNLSRSRSKTNSSKTDLSQTASTKMSKSKQLGSSKAASKSKTYLTQTNETCLSNSGMVKRAYEAPAIEGGEGENPMLTESQQQMALSTNAEQGEKLDEEDPDEKLENPTAGAESEDATTPTGDPESSQEAGPETEGEENQAEVGDGDGATGEVGETGKGDETGEGDESGEGGEIGERGETVGEETGEGGESGETVGGEETGECDEAGEVSETGEVGERNGQEGEGYKTTEGGMEGECGYDEEEPSGTDFGFFDWNAWDKLVSLINGEPIPNPCTNRGGACIDDGAGASSGWNDDGQTYYGDPKGGLMLTDTQSQETYIMFIALPLVILGLMASCQ